MNLDARLYWRSMGSSRQSRKRADSSGQLPAAELDVLALLWRQGPSTVTEIRKGILPFRPMAHGSVITLLKRLEEKKLVTATGKRGRAFIYAATQKPEPTYRRLVGSLLDRVFGGNTVSLVSSLFAGRAPKSSEIAQLRRLLDDLVDEQIKTSRDKEP
jgi:BlaI family penicillinase repressor